MIKKFITLTTAIAIISTLMFPTSLQAITAEDRLIEVERQLQAIADQISKYEGDKTDLEKAILENDQDLQQVNRELAEVQSKLQAAEQELDAALANYDGTLDDLSNVQQTIVQEQTKLGKIKNEIFLILFVSMKKRVNNIRTVKFQLLSKFLFLLMVVISLLPTAAKK